MTPSRPTTARLTPQEHDVFRRYAGLSLPRHVAYPMPNWWEPLDPETADSMRSASNQGHPRDLSLYVHIPFCQALCKFCGCNKVILKKELPHAADRVEQFLAAVDRELEQLAAVVASNRTVRQVHWGGGTPTYLDVQQIERLHGAITRRFTIAADAEQAVEVDPRVTTTEQLEQLRQLGFNRISLGVQDFDAQVQEHVRRVQPYEMVAATVDACRAAGFGSVNFDIIYGMPYQTVESVCETVERVVTLGPDRIAFYHYALVPAKIATQRGIDHTKLPSSDEKLEMFLLGREKFTEAGYEFIGLDHFARPQEALARSLEDGTITRNFQGMSTGRGLDLFGVGPSAISHLRDIGFLQNVVDTDTYASQMAAGRPVVWRGIELSRDDRIRQAIMEDLYATGVIELARYEKAFEIDFDDYFRELAPGLELLAREGVIRRESGGRIELTDPLGRILMRNVAALFDAYLEPDAYRVGARHEYSTNA